TSIGATLTFDAASMSATGSATVVFEMGPVGGNPVFDLRQTITALMLDGLVLAPTAAPHRDLGGGPGAEMRVLDATLAPGSAHVLEVAYDVGPPQSPAGGSYAPRLTWGPGPDVRLSFGFTDLHPARYLEAWLPANLIFDQYPVELTLQVTGTAVAHAVVTNAAVTDLGTNHWQLDFGDKTASLSTLVELRAASQLDQATTTVTLPATGMVTLEAHQPAGGPANLTAELGHLATWLTENETDIGPYAHGHRFVAHVDVGGMEYDGATTASPGNLRHETHHSWWGRGVKPASQADGWIDEAWTVYHDGGSTGSVPFDFTDPPVTLCDRNRWGRVTPVTAYSAGDQFFDGVASAMGVAEVRQAMAQFYVANVGRPTTTEALEEHLVTHSGRPELVDGFHRFVYGFVDSSPAPDLWLRDDPGDTGVEPWGGRFWDSPDLWCRHVDDGGTTHQDPEYGQDNMFYARVRNRGSGMARHFVVTFAVKPYAGVEFTYPADWLPCVTAVADFDLGPGQDRVVKARWPRALVPPPGTHACWLASVLTRGDQPATAGHTWERNNLAQKNLTIVDLEPNRWWTLPFVVPASLKRRPILLELRRPAGVPALEATLVHRAALKLPGAEVVDPRRLALPRGLDPERWASGAVARPEVKGWAFPPGEVASVRLPTRSGQSAFGLALRMPPGITEELTVDLVQREAGGKGRVLGGVAVLIRPR
ncbi:MAG TPA: hypothetical protein VIJ47_02815, partial [Acidimicrobiales bacterium]